jgi:thiamine-phosphate diphosphorylase
MFQRPLICLITDRRRLATRLALDPDGQEIGARLTDLVALAADASIDLVQVREPDLPTRTLDEWVGRFLDVVGSRETRIVVNDRLDVALAAGAHGVHLKDRPIVIERIRTAAPRGFLVGRSIHSPEQADDAGADYLVFGTVFPTRSKPDVPPAGLDRLEAAVRRARAPVLGIGGVTPGCLAEVASTGAAGVAAVDLFLPGGPGLTAPIQQVAKKIRQTFDTLEPPL